MEVQVKKDYASAVRKAKAQSKTGSEKAPPKGQKRKNEESEAHSSKRTKITVNVDGVSIDIDKSSAQSTKKKTETKETKQILKTVQSTASKDHSKSSTSKDTGQSTEKSKPKTPKVKDKDESRPATPKSTVSKAKASKQTGPASSQQPSKAEQAQAEPKAKTKMEPKAKADSKVKSEPKVKAEPKIKAEPKVKTESKVKKEPVLKSPIKKEPKVKQEPFDNEDSRADAATDRQPPPRNVTRVYELSCHQLEEQLPECGDSLRLFLCVDNENDQIWGGFELAMKSGIILFDDTAPDRKVSFGWRARDSWQDGRPMFGRGCFGEIELFGREQVRGTFSNLFNEPMEFEGRRRTGPLWCGRSAYSFHREWDGFVNEAYGR